MKINLVFLIVFLFSTELFGINNYSEIDKRSISVPDSLRTVDQISTYLTKDLKSEEEKVRAFYIWISHNIKYDLDKKNSGKKYISKTAQIDDVLEKRQGICSHYSALFNVFCQKSGIKSYVIKGYGRKGTGEISDLAHSWNAVQIDTNYYFIDVTWASGYVQNNIYVNQFRDEYFLIEPKIFIKTHLPFDPVWQFSDNPINILEFNNQNYLKLSIKGNYNFRALISEIENQNSLIYFEQLNKRLLSLEEFNDLILTEIMDNAFQITFEKCRIAVDSLNFATDNFNLYIKQKNFRFRIPHIEDSELRELISSVERPLYKADVILQNVFTFNPDLNIQISRFKKNIQEFESKMKIEKDFIDKYINTKKSFRFLLFIELKTANSQ
ncbi:MAG: hypothetical protein NTZ69_12290 [Bacteroidia bacterium]|nr:hypothetical protein [Bacteroidia bacterium]